MYGKTVSLIGLLNMRQDILVQFFLAEKQNDMNERKDERLYG